MGSVPSLDPSGCVSPVPSSVVSWLPFSEPNGAGVVDVLVFVLAGELANGWDTGAFFGAAAEPKAIVVDFWSVSDKFVQLPKVVLEMVSADEDDADVLNKFVAGGPKMFDDGAEDDAGAAKGKVNGVGAEPNTLGVPVVG